ncbi:glycosyltransferase family 4 protein [Planctomycetota bacterium]
MKTKVVIIIERADILLGGAERSIMELATALSGLGLKVDILAAKGQTSAKNIHILCSDRGGKRTDYFTLVKTVRKYLYENKYDIIHSVLPFDFADVYQPRGGTYIQAILRNAASYQNKLIESYKRLTAFANWRRTILVRAERKLCKNPDGPVIAALSNLVAGHFKEHYNVEDKRLVVIPNGIRINSRFEAGQADRLRSQILVRLGLKEADNPVLLLFVANNFRLKGLAILIKALKTAREKYGADRAYLVIAGHGKSYKYRFMAKKLGVHKRIIFLGHIHHVRNALSITDVAVLPTFYDPSSRFILEALATGKPVITTRFNGATDLFEHGRHGLVIDAPEDIDALAGAISHFTNTKKIETASEAIEKDNLKERVSIRQAAKKLQSLYESILERKSRK